MSGLAHIRHVTQTVVLATVEARLRRLAHDLAADADRLTGTTPEQRCDLRSYPMEMLRLADALLDVRGMS